jgi:hypothetical protein
MPGVRSKLRWRPSPFIAAAVVAWLAFPPLTPASLAA